MTLSGIFRKKFALVGEPVTRFAPSPNGWLHMGHALHALYLWGLADLLGASVVTRLEDHDRSRCRDEYCEGIIRDMKWLGFLKEDEPPPFRQSLNPEPYRKNIQKLLLTGKAYWCSCSRKQVRARLKEAMSPGIVYDGHCRERGLSEGEGCSLRLRLSPGQTVEYTLLGTGKTKEDPSQTYGDFTLVDREGNYTYHLSVVTDDLIQKINLIIRGEDLKDSTGPQMALRELIEEGAGQPVYFHHPLIWSGKHGVKLSKSLGSEPVSLFREKGCDPKEVLGLTAFRAGLIPAQRPFSLQDMKGLLARRLDELLSY